MSLFQRRHYEWLAAFCADEQRMAQNFQGSMFAHIEATTEHLISRLREDNPQFKPDRFRDKVAKLRGARSIDDRHNLDGRTEARYDSEILNILKPLD